MTLGSKKDNTDRRMEENDITELDDALHETVTVTNTSERAVTSCREGVDESAEESDANLVCVRVEVTFRDCVTVTQEVDPKLDKDTVGDAGTELLP